MELLHAVPTVTDHQDSQTTCLLTSVVYALTENPSILSRLRGEILDTCGTSGVPTIKELRSLKYLRAVLDEALRLWPPVYAN